MNLHQREYILMAEGKHLSITIQNCEPIREAAFKSHIDAIEKLINGSDAFNIASVKSDKKREAMQHISILDSFNPEQQDGTMGMTPKQQILDSLTRAYLVYIACDLGVKGARYMYKKDLVTTLSRMRSVKLDDILTDMSLKDLKIICQNLGLDDTGINIDCCI